MSVFKYIYYFMRFLKKIFQNRQIKFAAADFRNAITRTLILSDTAISFRDPQQTRPPENKSWNIYTDPRYRVWQQERGMTLDLASVGWNYSAVDGVTGARVVGTMTVNLALQRRPYAQSAAGGSLFHPEHLVTWLLQVMALEEIASNGRYPTTAEEIEQVDINGRCWFRFPVTQSESAPMTIYHCPLMDDHVFSIMFSPSHTNDAVQRVITNWMEFIVITLSPMAYHRRIQTHCERLESCATN